MTSWLRHSLGLEGRDRLLGLLFVVLVACIWVFASFLVQDIEAIGVHPVVITFVSNSLFALYFPVYWLGQYFSAKTPKTASDIDYLQVEMFTLPSWEHWRSDPRDALKMLSTNPLFRAACQVAPLWFFAQLTFNISLSKTSVTSNTILSSASSLFTFLLSVYFLSEKFTCFKLSCIVALMIGTAMVTFSDATSSSEDAEISSVIGDLLCLVSAVLYGMYTVSIKRLIPGDDASVPMTLFFGMMGVLITCIGGPIILFSILLGASFGSFSWSVFLVLILKGCLDNVLSDYLWARSILLIGMFLFLGIYIDIPQWCSRKHTL